MESISRRLLELRRSIGLSQAKLGKELNANQSAINRYENNQSSPPVDLLCRYADFFDVSLDYICCRTDKPQGKLYEHKPRYIPKSDETRRFIEMCFDPDSSMNARLKEALLRMMEEES